MEKMKIKSLLKQGYSGMTLIEMVVSMALLAILSLMLVSCMTVYLSDVRIVQKRSNNADSAASQIEAKHASSVTNGTPASPTIAFNGNTYTVSGIFTNANSGNITYHEFVPNP